MKKSITFLVTFLLISVFSNAQITFTPYVQADFTSYTAFIIDGDFQDYEAYQELLDYKQNFSQPMLIYNTGIYINYPINEKWEIKSGLTFQEMSDRTVRNQPIGFPNLDKIENISYHNFLTIPLQVQYNLKPIKRLSPYFSFGSNLYRNIESGYRDIIYYGNGRVSETYDVINILRKVNFSLKTDFGFEYKITEKLNWNAFISSNFLILPTIKNDFFNLRHYNIGLGLGLGYTI